MTEPDPPFEQTETVRVRDTQQVGRVGYASAHLVIVWFEEGDVGNYKPAELERLEPRPGRGADA